MAINITKNFDFLAGIHHEGNFIMNNYSIMLTMDVNTDSIKEQNIAMDRLKYFIYETLHSVIFIHDKETNLISKFQELGLKVCTLPEQPYDQIITMMIFYKLNTITENKLYINNIQLDSDLSDGVGFMWSDDEAKTLTPYGQGWWTENSTSICDKVSSTNKEKIVKLVKKSYWSNIGLDWKDKEPSKSNIIRKPESQK